MGILQEPGRRGSSPCGRGKRLGWLGVALIGGLGMTWGIIGGWAGQSVDARGTTPQKLPSGNPWWHEPDLAGLSAMSRELQGASAAAGGTRRILRLETALLSRSLSSATNEMFRTTGEQGLELPMPLPDGQMVTFRIEESSILAPSLAARYPEIRTFTGQAVNYPGGTMRCDLTPQGFHATMLLPEGTVTIQPLTPNAPGDLYLIYTGLPPGLTEEDLATIHCDLPEAAEGAIPQIPEWQQNAPLVPEFRIGGILRVFRLAIATTWEYANAYGAGTNAGTVASIVTWLNGVNLIYERELSIRLQLVDEPSMLFTSEQGYSATTDPFANGSTLSMLNELGPVMRSLSDNAYDVGHVLGTGGGGVAYLGVACANVGAGGGPPKGLGVTLLSGPIGNTTGVKVWAHELGHQFGAYHSFNGTTGNCNASNRAANSAYESGAGSTIMSYAGICSGDNITAANEFDLRFHGKSLQQILSLVEGRARCFRALNTTNSPPTVTAGNSFTIPRLTPFSLTAIANDSDPGDADNLTYTWEQVDAGGTLYGNPSYHDDQDPITTTRPTFRPFPPTTLPTRIFPQLTHILESANLAPEMTGNLRTAESLPRVSRNLQFGVTVRDNRSGGGGIAHETVRLTVAGEAGPFRVLSPNTAVTWTGGSRQQVTWEVSETNRSPVNCSQVKILLSTDGGRTFPTVLHHATPNDGSETITLPAGMSTTEARLQVEAVGNIFFDISDVDFTLLPGVAPVRPTIEHVAWTPSPPQAGQVLQATLRGTGFVIDETRLLVCESGTTNCTAQPRERVTVASPTRLELRSLILSAGSWEIYVQTPTGDSNRTAPVRLQATTPSFPTITRLAWTPVTPSATQPFSGVVTGTNFVPEGTRVYFCSNGSNRCTLHASSGVVVPDTTTVRLSGVILGSGAWQVIVETAAGASGRSTPFSVLEDAPSPPPTLTGATWTPLAPLANQPFSGVLTGNHLVMGATQVFFCPAGSTECQEQPASAVSVSGTTSLSVTGVLLTQGNWQAHVQTPAGTSNQTAILTVTVPPATSPTITQATWSPASPLAEEPFSGTLIGTNFAPGSSRLQFCRTGTDQCLTQPLRTLQVLSSTRVTVTEVRLAAGDWQAQLQSSGRLSNRSASFRVQGKEQSAPTVTGYQWNPTVPLANQPFTGKVTGTGFAAGLTRLHFCPVRTDACLSVGATLVDPTQLEVGPVTLASGQWDLQVETPGGTSPRTPPFSVQPPPPLLPTLLSFASSVFQPIASQPFAGTLQGTGFIPGSTEILFCRPDSNDCLSQPVGSMTSTTATLDRIVLSEGRWQVQVRTPVGLSNRTAPFSVAPRSAEQSPPTILSYTWNPDRPLANQPFTGTITGTGFVPGATQLYFCVAGTDNCTPHPLERTITTQENSLQVTHLVLPSANWEFFLQTPRGSSHRSASFPVTEPPSFPPVISAFLWRPATPRANTTFEGVLIGSHFEVGATRVFFCVNLTNTCTEVPAEKVIVNNPTSVTLSDLILPRGTWQVYLQTSISRSNRSRSFVVM